MVAMAEAHQSLRNLVGMAMGVVTVAEMVVVETAAAMGVVTVAATVTIIGLSAIYFPAGNLNCHTKTKFNCS
jgi:hypothetical protein